MFKEALSKPGGLNRFEPFNHFEPFELRQITKNVHVCEAAKKPGVSHLGLIFDSFPMLRNVQPDDLYILLNLRLFQPTKK
jgi:hypothetical protein